MFMRTIGRRGVKPFIICALSFAAPLAAGETPVAPDAGSPPKPAAEASASSSEIEQLRRMILEQQRQIDELRRAMADKKGEGSPVTAAPSRGQS